MNKIMRLATILNICLLASGCTGIHSRNPSFASLESAGVQTAERNKHLALVLPSDLAFSPGSTRLNPRIYPLLIKIADILMKDYPNANIKVAGYTDSSGTPERNRSISITRARVIAGYLRYRGIDRERIDAVGFGDTHPIATNETLSGRIKNRRIEIYIN